MSELQFKINGLNKHPDHDGFVTVHWTAFKEVEGRKFTYIDATHFFPNVNAETFVPFDSLTEDLVVEIVKNQVGKGFLETVEKSVDTQIEMSKKPTVESSLPWAPAEIVEPVQE